MKDIAFQKHLSSVILDNKYDRFVKNRKTGKLDTNSLYKINHSNKLFKKREARQNKDYSVTLMVDTSGSMSGERIEIAAESAAKLSWHLAKMQIPHNVVLFNLGVYEAKPFGTGTIKNLKKVILDNAMGDLRHYYFWQDDGEAYVDHAEKKGKKLFPFIGMVRGSEEKSRLRKKYEEKGVYCKVYEGPGFNSDAEAIRVGREHLLKQKGRKIMIHLSDGQPVPLYVHGYESPIHLGTEQKEYNLKREVDVTLTAGIELYSIGIQSYDVERFYPKKRTQVIRDLHELYPAIISLIKRNLKRG